MQVVLQPGFDLQHSADTHLHNWTCVSAVTATAFCDARLLKAITDAANTSYDWKPYSGHQKVKTVPLVEQLLVQGVCIIAIDTGTLFLFFNIKTCLDMPVM